MTSYIHIPSPDPSSTIQIIQVQVSSIGKLKFFNFNYSIFSRPYQDFQSSLDCY